MSFIVTGAAGFIGSVFVKELNKLSYRDIYLVDRLESDGKWKNLLGKEFLDFIHADELEQKLTGDFCSQIQGIFHFGACSSTTEQDADYLLKNNYEYSKMLFLKAVEYNIPFYYASSAATYGGGELGYSDKTHPKELRPLNPYGYSKCLFDSWCLAQEKTPAQWNGFKFFNVFGPNEYHKGGMVSVVYQAFKQIKDSGEVKLFKSHREDFEDGMQIRDFIYVKDVVSVMLKFFEDPKENGNGIFNLGTGTGETFYNFVAATFKALNLDVSIKYIDMPEHLQAQYQYYTQANMSSFFSIYPEFSFLSLEDGVRDYVQSYLAKGFAYH